TIPSHVACRERHWRYSCGAAVSKESGKNATTRYAEACSLWGELVLILLKPPEIQQLRVCHFGAMRACEMKHSLGYFCFTCVLKDSEEFEYEAQQGGTGGGSSHFASDRIRRHICRRRFV